MNDSLAETNKTAGAEIERPAEGTQTDAARQHVERDPPVGPVLASPGTLAQYRAGS